MKYNVLDMGETDRSLGIAVNEERKLFEEFMRAAELSHFLIRDEYRDSYQMPYTEGLWMGWKFKASVSHRATKYKSDIDREGGWYAIVDYTTNKLATLVGHKVVKWSNDNFTAFKTEEAAAEAAKGIENTYQDFPADNPGVVGVGKGFVGVEWGGKWEDKE